MISSMTAFSRKELTAPWGTLSWELRSVNHRYLEISPRLPDTLRDLENPDLWTESYHVPAWVEYVRHNERRTFADLDVSEKLRALHRGPGLPKVHRMIERHSVSELRTTPGRRPEAPSQ